MSARPGVLDVMDASREVFEALGTVAPEAGVDALKSHDEARATLAELIAADVEYDAACAAKARIHSAWKIAHDLTAATDADLLPLRAADARLQAAEARRAAALAAVQGGEA